MIYKFIDNNGSEISVNSLSSLQALVDSETIKEDTKVKAGLRGKWTTASNIEELVFNQEVIEEENETVAPEENETVAPEDDIKSFTTIEEKPEEVSAQQFQTKKEHKSNEKTEVTIEEKNELNEEIIVEEKPEKINFFDAIKICFNKYFVFDGRASRSEYWWFFLFTIIIDILCELLDISMGYEYGEFGLFFFISLITVIPGIAVTARRLHDTDKSGWWMLISFTIIGVIPLLVWLISQGDEKENRFGEYPYQLNK